MQSQELLLTMDEFLTMSARINYLLSAKQPSFEAILNKIMGGRMLCGDPVLMEEGVAYLWRVYRNRSRRLGPMAVLHPLRVAHLLVLVHDQPRDIDLLTAFLHDFYEDIHTQDTEQGERNEIQWRFEALLEPMDEPTRQELDARMRLLTRAKHEEYHEYLGRLLERAIHTPELLWIKLADRLDNTFDMRVVDQESGPFFRMIFDILFLQSNLSRGLAPTRAPAGQMDEAHRLYQMFKNAIFLTLVRRCELDELSEPAQRLFTALAAASLQEAGRILMHIFTYHIRDIKKQRAILIDAMEYCVGGGINRITPSQRGNKLDGLFKERFDHSDRKTREHKLKILQEDKDMMASAALAFISVFENFLNSPHFQLSGIRSTGISTEDTLA